jgi:catechol 2,3-dioxygenase-like lactoylglutathione lyase family enzyme
VATGTSRRRPVNALRVGDLAASVQFYCEGLGFGLDWRDDAAGVAQVSPHGEMPLLLAAGTADEIAPYMNEVFSEVPPGRRLYLAPPGPMGEYRAALVARGVRATEIQVQDGGDQVMAVVDPDGYVLAFWQAAHLTDEEVMARFERGPALLRAALEGLTEAQLDLARAPGKWTIRQIVHHMVDSASSSLVRILMALAEPGRPFRNNPYSQDKWVAGLDHAHQPIETAVALLTAIHAHVSMLVHHVEAPLDRPLDRSLATDLGGTVTVRTMLTMLGAHVAGHVAQIRQTREVHGV